MQGHLSLLHQKDGWSWPRPPVAMRRSVGPGGRWQRCEGEAWWRPGVREWCVPSAGARGGATHIARKGVNIADLASSSAGPALVVFVAASI